MRLIVLSLVFLFFFCQKPAGQQMEASEKDAAVKTVNEPIILAAERFEQYLPLLKGKRVALTVNQTSKVGEVHLVDTLISKGVNIVKVFAPEHGFRGTADAGEHVENSVDKKTGLPILSLHGSNKKPTAEQLANVDVLLFDIQDVGVRFYTYISTMHYIMEAAAENDKEVIILDRPNPHGMYIDGPVLDTAYRSFLGMHAIPLVHGLTVGELAKMINGEGWLKKGIKSKLKVVEMKNYDHTKSYNLPVKPSPNLPNNVSVALYPSLGLFEGTNISVGRGTYAPFQQIGHPELEGKYAYYFVPESIEGMSKYPPFEGEEVYGLNLQEEEPEYRFTLKYLIEMYNALPDKSKFFRKGNGFELHAGDEKLREQIQNGLNEEEIKASWEADLENYRQIRKKYLLYPDFE